MTEATIGDALLAIRKQRHLDQGRAAAEIGVSPSTYRSYEKNTQRPSVNVFPLLSKFLGLEIEEFLPLYGATVIFALRPALERELALQGSGDTIAHSDDRPSDGDSDLSEYDSVEDETQEVLESSSRNGLSYVEVVAAMEVRGSDQNENQIVDDGAVNDVDDDDDDDDDDGDEEDDEDLDQEAVARFDDESGMNMGEAPVASTVSQATSWPSGDLKSTKAKKKKKKNKKR